MKMIWTRFNMNVEALWSFILKMSPAADEEDRRQVKQAAQRVAQLFDEDRDDVEKELFQSLWIGDEDEIEPNLGEKPVNKELIDALKTGGFQKNAQNWIKKNPTKRKEFYRLMGALFDPAAANGTILRRSVFIILVSFFESLLIDLLHIYYENAQVSKQVERAIEFGPLTERLNLIEATGAALNPFNDLKEKVFEICQRRNLFTHNDGVIDEYYLKQRSNHPSNVVLGCRFRITDRYLLRSLESVLQYGFFLLQTCWRFWGNRKQDQADNHYGDALLALLKRNRYPLVIQLAEGSKNFKLSKRGYQTTIINHAIALRETGQINESKKLIHSEIHSPSDQKIELAVKILREDYDSALILLIQMGKNGKIKELSSDWPIFRPVSTDHRFIPYLERMS